MIMWRRFSWLCCLWALYCLSTATLGEYKPSSYHSQSICEESEVGTIVPISGDSACLDKSKSVEKAKGVILFDGICNFCNFWVDLLIRCDPSCKFQLCAIQTKKGKKLLEGIGILDSQEQLSSVVLISSVGERDQIIYKKSTAILKVVSLFVCVYCFLAVSFLIIFLFMFSMHAGCATVRKKWIYICYNDIIDSGCDP